MAIENEKKEIVEHVGDQVITETVKAEIVDMYFDCVTTIKMEKDKEREEIKQKAKKIEVKLGDKLLQNFSQFFSKTPTFKKGQSQDISPSVKADNKQGLKIDNLKKDNRAKSVSQVLPGAKNDNFGEVTAFSTDDPPKELKVDLKSASQDEEVKYSTNFDQADINVKHSAFNTIFNKSAPTK